MDDDIPSVVGGVREMFESGITVDVQFRRRMLNKLVLFYEQNEKQLTEVIYQDIKKHPFEVVITEITYLIQDCRTLLHNLDQWTSPFNVKRSLATLFDRPYVRPEPYGVALVLGAWNYPLQLLLAPVAGAIAAGNCVIIKPSDQAPATALFLSRTLPLYLDRRCYPVVLGDSHRCAQLLQQRFDYIFYTGGATVGRLVHQAANAHLTPVTLELGGKSPVFLDDTVNMEIAVRRIMWGKVVNLGQTCIAPDYLLCSRHVQKQFVTLAAELMRQWFGSDSQHGSTLGRIVNRRHFDRLERLLKCGGGEVAVGGSLDADDLFIEPTILINVQPDDPLMQQEIFGPLLPIITVDSAQQAVQFINNRPSPLACYVFSNNQRVVDRLVSNVRAGGVTINDVIVQVTVEELPFGGVGASGMGQYHGRHSFDTFTHYKPVLHRGFNSIIEKLCSVRYPPYSEASIARAKLLLKNPRFPSMASLKLALMFCVGFSSACLLHWTAKKFGFDKNLPQFLR